MDYQYIRHFKCMARLWLRSSSTSPESLIDIVKEWPYLNSPFMLQDVEGFGIGMFISLGEQGSGIAERVEVRVTHDTACCMKR